MKKILSMIIAVAMSLSMLCVVPAFATENNYITDSNNTAAVAFKDYIESNNLVFDDNFFYMGEYAHDSSIEVVYALGLKVTTTSEKQITLGIGIYDENKGTVQGVPYYDCDNFEEAYKTTVVVSKDAPVLLSTNGMGYDKFTPAIVGVALQNASSLTDETTVTVDLVQVNETENVDEVNQKITIDITEIENGKVDTISKTFSAPINFDNEDYAGIAKVLTAIDFGNTVSYEDVVSALTGISNATDVSSEDSTKLAGALTDDVLKTLAEIVAAENSGKDVITNSGVVTLPYVALAQAPAVDGTSYAVEAEKVEATEVAPTGKDAVVAYDITIKADDSEVANPVVAQKVVIDLPNGWNKTGVQYKHGSDDWADATVENGKVIFYADSFSVFTLAGTKVAADETASDNKADRVEFKLVQDEVNKNKFSVVIAPTDTTKQIFKFATAAMEVQFRNDGITEDAMETFTYELKAADGISITNLEDVSIADDAVIGGFTFVATAEDGNLITAPVGEAIVIAEIEITGKGKFKVMSDSAEVKNVIYTETLEDNEAVAVSVVANNWSNVFEIPEQKYELTINVDFGLNKIETDDADYLGMTVTLVGSISKEEKVLNIGEELAVTLSADTATATDKIELPAKENYEFVIKGLGYRTFRGNVYLDENKTINLWNNAKTSGSVNVIADDDTTAKDVTFLVGDIYMDGIVDIYDLSAATSYYGAENIDKANTNVYACDLNRDGKITIADIAYVQVSYGN